VTTVLTGGQHLLEKHFGQGHNTPTPGSGGFLRNVVRLQRRGSVPAVESALEKGNAR
jgi:hypothetical protein